MERNMSLRSSSITSERMEELRRKRMEARQASNGEAAVTSVTPELERRATARSQKIKSMEDKLNSMEQIMSESGKMCTGVVRIDVTYNKRSSKVHMLVIDCQGLAAADANGFSDPYVKVWLHRGKKDSAKVKGSKRKTKIIYKNLNPTFDENLIFDHVTEDAIDELYFHIEVMDYDAVGKNDFLGHSWVPVASAAMVRGRLTVRLNEAGDASEWDKSTDPGLTERSKLQQNGSSASDSRPPRPLQPKAGKTRSGNALDAMTRRVNPKNSSRNSLKNSESPQVSASQQPFTYSNGSPESGGIQHSQDISSKVEDTNDDHQGKGPLEYRTISQLTSELDDAKAQITRLEGDIKERDRYLDSLIAKVMDRCPEILTSGNI